MFFFDYMQELIIIPTFDIARWNPIHDEIPDRIQNFEKIRKEGYLVL